MPSLKFTSILSFVLLAGRSLAADCYQTRASGSMDASTLTNLMYVFLKTIFHMYPLADIDRHQDTTTMN